MSSKLPYMATPGTIPKILTKIQEAKKPDKFTQDFLETKLGFAGGNSKAIIPLLKRMGFLNSDGTPTSLYDRFRNVTTQGAAAAEGMRKYAGDLTKDKLKALIVEVTGAAHDDRTVELALSTFLKLKDFADFEASASSVASNVTSAVSTDAAPAITVPMRGATNKNCKLKMWV